MVIRCGWRRVLSIRIVSGHGLQGQRLERLGSTQAMAAAADYYVKHDRPKALFVKELKPRPAQLVRGTSAGGVGAVVESKVAAWPPCGSESCVPCASTLPVCRLSRRVESYPLSSVLAMVGCAHLCGAPRGHRDLKAFGRRFTQRSCAPWSAPKPQNQPLPFPQQSDLRTGVAPRSIRCAWKRPC